MKNLFYICILTVSFMLSGCGQTEPTEAEINDALKTSFEIVNKNISKSAGVTDAKIMESITVKFISARKISCTPTDKKHEYDCTVEIKTEVPIVGTRKAITSLPFIKDGDKWVVVVPVK
ncbi:hypothetical protein [Escherichia coli]|uniref:hypothetical protein n=1 Tax=Escherichia coli TaxID=562 RepID=UPI0038B40E3F